MFMLRVRYNAPEQVHNTRFLSHAFNHLQRAIAPPFHPHRRPRRRPGSPRSSPATGRSSLCGLAKRKSASTEEKNRQRPAFLHAASKAGTGDVLPCLDVKIACS